jgi:uncharacterized protein
VTIRSALYVGRVTHHRLRPRRHSLGYRSYWLLLDLDEIDALPRHLKLFSHNRFNLFSFHDRDHGTGDRRPLREAIEGRLEASGTDLDGGPIRLLAMPRLLGYVFNPISIYFCHYRDGALAALVYQVHNTFGERHSYVIAVEEPRRAGPIRQDCSKRFHVSPFLGMDMRYDFRVIEPAEMARLIVRGSDHDGDLIVASMLGTRVPLTDVNLIRVFVTHPLLTLKVTFGIHFEAVLLWLKGLRLYPKPAAPAEPVTAKPARQRRAA